MLSILILIRMMHCEEWERIITQSINEKGRKTDTCLTEWKETSSSLLRESELGWTDFRCEWNKWSVIWWCTHSLTHSNISLSRSLFHTAHLWLIFLPSPAHNVTRAQSTPLTWPDGKGKVSRREKEQLFNLIGLIQEERQCSCQFNCWLHYAHNESHLNTRIKFFNLNSPCN